MDFVLQGWPDPQPPWNVKTNPSQAVYFYNTHKPVFVHQAEPSGTRESPVSPCASALQERDPDCGRTREVHPILLQGTPIFSRAWWPLLGKIWEGTAENWRKGGGCSAHPVPRGRISQSRHVSGACSFPPCCRKSCFPLSCICRPGFSLETASPGQCRIVSSTTYGAP